MTSLLTFTLCRAAPTFLSEPVIFGEILNYTSTSEYTIPLSLGTPAQRPDTYTFSVNTAIDRIFSTTTNCTTCAHTTFNMGASTTLMDVSPEIVSMWLPGDFELTAGVWVKDTICIGSASEMQCLQDVEFFAITDGWAYLDVFGLAPASPN